uniref:Uncharacterized protein n=1 Tax=Arundo donax TaxID=35708 RepID=A0A0A9BCM0_ARUDO
MYRGNIYASEI